MKKIFIALLVTVVCALQPSYAANAMSKSSIQMKPFITKPNYTYIELGNLGTMWETPSDINDKNVVVGTTYSTNYDVRAFIWMDSTELPTSNKMQYLLPKMPNCYSNAMAINNNNDVVGTYNCTGILKPFIYNYNTKSFKDLAIPSSVVGSIYYDLTDINDKGQIVGGAFMNGNWIPLFWDSADSVKDLSSVFAGTLGGAPKSINNNCDIVGYYRVGADSGRAFKMNCRNFMLQDLGVINGAQESSASSINENGLITGASGAGTGWQQPVIWESNSITLLPTTGTGWMNATSINNNRQVVGEYSISENIIHGYYYENDVIWDLNSFLPVTIRKTEIIEAKRINNKSNIIGTYTNDNTLNLHSFIMIRR